MIPPPPQANRGLKNGRPGKCGTLAVVDVAVDPAGPTPKFPPELPEMPEKEVEQHQLFFFLSHKILNNMSKVMT